MHDTLGQSAALVNSAKRGFLYSQGTSIILESVGAQSIVNTSIYGDNNVADISANQTSSNTGNVNAVGSITLSGNASTTTTSTNTTTAPKPTTTTNPTSTPGSAGAGQSGTGQTAGSAAAAGAAAGGTTAGNTTNSSTIVGNGPGAAASGP